MPGLTCVKMLEHLRSSLHLSVASASPLPPLWAGLRPPSQTRSSKCTNLYLFYTFSRSSEVLALLEDVGSRAWEEAAHTTEAPSPACWLTWQAARLASGDASQCDALVPRLRVWHFFDAAIPFLQWRAEPTDIIMDAILGSCVPQRSCAWFVANARLRTALWSTILNRLAEQSDNETLPDDHTERADLLVKWFQKMVALADALHAPDRGVMLAEMQALWDERSDDINDAKVHADFEKFAKQRASPERPSNVQDLLAALRVSLA